jgi:hypothetical protein
MFEDQMYLNQQDESDRFCEKVYPPEDLTEAYRKYCDYCEGQGIKPVCYEVFLRG